MQNKLFVGSLPWSTESADLQTLFSKAGTVVSADVVTERESGRSRGFAFVVMETPEEAEKAIEMFDGSTIEDRTIVVNIARPKENRPADSDRF